MTTSNGSLYGLLRSDALPDAPHIETVIPGLHDRVVVTSDLPDAKNHCAATAIANLALYFGNVGKSSALSETPEETLCNVYEMVGNGPILFFKRKAERYFRHHGKIISMRAVSRRELSFALVRGHICVLLLRDGLFKWHWVLAVGERVYASGSRYLVVLDGWHRSRPSYLEIRGCSYIVRAFECTQQKR